MILTPKVRHRLRQLATLANTTVHLSRASHPLAWASAAVSIASEFFGENKHEPACWPKASWPVRSAIASVACQAHLGNVISVDAEGDELREYEGCRFGHSNAEDREWMYGPAGDPTVLPRWVWEHLGTAIVIATHVRDTNNGIALRTDRLTGTGSGAFVRKATSEIAAKRAHGLPVGVLLEGTKGGGKSHAMRAIAEGLGGFSLRARLCDVNDDHVLGLVDVLAPKTVIFDDIDRGATSQALDLIELLMDRGVVVLASCNRVQQVDDSLIRARRLGLHYTLGAIESDVLETMIAGRSLTSEVVDELGIRTVAEVADFLGDRDALGEVRALEILRGRQQGGDPATLPKFESASRALATAKARCP